MGSRRALRVALIAAAIGLAAAAVSAVASLRAISGPRLVQVPVPAEAVHAGADVVTGTVREGLPPFALHWDGQPPAAVLVDASTGAVLAAAALSDRTFEQNANAVRFVEGEARFRLDARRWDPAVRLALRCEAVGSRRPFVFFSLLTAVLTAVLLVLGGSAWYLATPVERRRSLRFTMALSAVIVAVAAAEFASHYPGAPIRVDEVTDEAAINSFAAARDHPERFTGDAFLNDPANFAWYIPVYVDAVRATRALGFHYQTAYAFIGAAIVVVLFAGLYALFATVSGSLAFAAAAALGLGLMTDVMPPDEYWGIFSALPRVVFAACVPWIMLAAVACAPSARRWWIACALAGLLVYVYPLSAPVFVGMIAVAFAAGSDEPWTARLHGLLLAFVAVAVTLGPYVLVFTGRYRSMTAMDAQTTARELAIVTPAFADLAPGRVLHGLLLHRITTLRIVLDGLAAVLLLRRPVDRPLRFYAGLVLGFVCLTFGVPLLDGAVAELSGRRHYAYELIRAVRYVDFLLVWALALAVRRWRGTRRLGAWWLAAGTVCALVAFGPGWVATARQIGGNARLSWRTLSGDPKNLDAEDAQEAIRAVEALRPAGARVWGPLGLRQFGVPLAWLQRDIVTLAYTASPGLLEAARVMGASETVLARPLTADSLARLARIGGADLFLLRHAQIDERLSTSWRVLFRNRTYAVVTARPMVQ